VSHGWKTIDDRPVKHFDMQAAMSRHLSQSIGVGALAGQHGMSLAISSAVADISLTIPDIAASGIAPAIMGRDNGAKANPAIMKIASSRRMVI
jgi:hypothetical protein